MPDLISRNIAALEAFYGIRFRYDAKQKRFRGIGKNGRVILSVGTTGVGELFGFSIGEMMPSDKRPKAEKP